MLISMYLNFCMNKYVDSILYCSRFFTRKKSEDSTSRNSLLYLPCTTQYYHTGNMAKENRIVVLDVLRVISILGVVCIHTSSRTLEQSGYDILRIPLALVFNEVFRFAVPLFFLLSGFVLEHRYKEITLVLFYKKRLPKIIIPYIAWSVIYHLFYYKNSVSSLFNLDFLKKLYIGSTSIQMYFIPALVILYLLFPFLHRYLSIFKKHLLLLFLLFILGTFLDYYFKLPISDTIRLIPLHAFVFSLGMLASHFQTEIIRYTKSRRLLVFLILAASVFGVVYESKYRFLWNKNMYTISSNWRICVYMGTFALAALIFAFYTKNSKKYNVVIEALSKLSFFVFFVHIFFISVFWKLIGGYLFSVSMGHVVEALWFDPLVFVFVTTASFATAFICSKIPKVRGVLGIR
jgi:probable poly-beta-1,6-N-acetyl-D-glucosamine export protein